MLQWEHVDKTFSIKIIQRIREVSSADWDRLLAEASPFLKWDWLDLLEETGCANEKTGWLPHHVIVEREGELVGACPMYLKLHSMGEFVFDWDWAEYAGQMGIRYYPKLLVGVPFTPVTGPRFLTAPREDRPSLIRLLGEVLKRIAQESKLSSVHVNFCLEDEAETLQKIDFAPRLGLQFHWENAGYSSFEEYLSAFHSDRRTKIRREIRELSNQGISIRSIEGDEMRRADLRTMFQLYRTQVDRHPYGHQYLTEAFFEALSRRFNPYLCLIFAQRDSQVIAGTLNVQDHAVFYGRYWGSFVEERYLHFNVCYYAAIDHCIRKGLKRFEAGAGGSFKQFRGLEPQFARSMHFIVEERFRRAVEKCLREERRAIHKKRETLLERSQLKKASHQN